MEKESVFELDLKLDDVLKLTAAIADKGKERTQQEQDIFNFLYNQSKYLDDRRNTLSFITDIQKEQLAVIKKKSDVENKEDKKADARRKKEREHIGFLKKSFDWLTGYQGIKGFLNMRVPSLPGMVLGGAATGLGLGMAGYYGYGRMAQGAGNLRFQGQGAFSSPAQLQAAKSVFENRWFSNTDAMVQNIEGLRTNASDPAGLIKLEKLVGKIDGAMSNVDILAKMPAAIQKNVSRYIKETGDKDLKLTGYQGTLAAYGLDFLSPDVIRRGMPGTMEAKETAGLESVYKKTVKEFEPMLGDKGLMQYQNTKMQMDLAMLRIENSFMDALKGLNPEIKHLSESASLLIKEFVRSDVIAKAIDNLKTGLHEFDDWLKDDKRKDTLSALLYDLDVFGGMVYSAASGLGGLAKMLGFAGENTLKATEYQALLGIRETNPVLADKMKEALENPNDASRHNEAIQEFKGLPTEKQKELTEKYGKQFNTIFAGALQFDNSLSMDLKEVNQFLKQSSVVYKTLNDVLGAGITGGLATIDFVKEQATDTQRYFGIKPPSIPSFFPEAQAGETVKPVSKEDAAYFQYKEYLKSKKIDGQPITEQFAIGVLANAALESSFNPKAKDYKNKHHGLFQWSPERQAGFENQTGKKVLDSNWQEQIDYLIYELAHSEKKAGDLMRKNANNSQAVAAIMRGELERPAKKGTPEYYKELDNARKKAAYFERLEKPSKLDYSGLKLKSSETIAGGKAHPATIELARVLQSQITGFNRVTGINDLYHKNDKTSKHSHGLAVDFTIADKTKSREVEKQIYDIMESLNVKGYVLDEYTKKSKRKTAPHMHVNFKSENEADKFYSELQKPKSYQQPVIWQPVIMKRGEESVQKTMGEPKVLTPKKQNSTSVKITIDNRSGTDLTSQSVSAGL